jgi:RHS repeat-associated protein
VIGHILRNRTINSTSYAKTDRWFAYDQVGSLLATMNSAGDVSERMHQDAFGHPVGNWTHGTWSSSSVGWRHNTKEIDADAGLTYMYQRWYDQTTGRFASVAPYPPMVEHPYGFGLGDPMTRLDPLGENPGIVAYFLGCQSLAMTWEVSCAEQAQGGTPGLVVQDFCECLWGAAVRYHRCIGVPITVTEFEFMATCISEYDTPITPSPSPTPRPTWNPMDHPDGNQRPVLS